MEYKCLICNKNYKSYQSIWNHNNKFHKNENITITKTDNNINKAFICKHCNKTFTTNYRLNTHIKKSCKVYNSKTTTLENEVSQLKNDIDKLKIIAMDHINKNLINNTNENLSDTLLSLKNNKILTISKNVNSELLFEIIQMLGYVLIKYYSELDTNDGFIGTVSINLSSNSDSKNEYIPVKYQVTKTNEESDIDL